MAKKPRLTVKEAKLVKGIAQGKKKQQAGIDAGYSGKPSTVSVTVSDVLKKPKVQEALQKELEKQGIGIEQVVAPVVKALTATQVIRHKDGTLEATNEDDIELQLKGHDRAMKILQPTKDSDNGNTINNFGQMILEQKDKYSE